ncbi:MAG: hypothetical protein CMJ78_07195 [Planctomycetaceae bacterium]|nr:hypothetical protein [Planctomycetaceae bacterium]
MTKELTLKRLAYMMAVLSLACLPCMAQEEADGDAKEAKVDNEPLAPIAALVVVKGVVDEVTFSRITNAAHELQHQAVQESRDAYLMLELHRGSSRFGQIHELAKSLTSADLTRVKKVAWIPEPEKGETLDGMNAILALACNEIIMHPDAEIGDITRDKELGVDEQQLVVNLVERRHNPKVNKALALAMMDSQQVIRKVDVEITKDGNKTTESRVVTDDELRTLRELKTVIMNPEIIKDAGVVGTFSGERARALDILVVRTATDRNEIRESYGLPFGALRDDPTVGQEVKPVMISIEGVIDYQLQEFVNREIDRAIANGANMIIFDVDSPGGLLDPSRQISDKIADLEEDQVRTVAYIDNEAISGAAIISFGCDEIYLKPDAMIGDAAPIEVRPGGAFERAPEKILSIVREIMKITADKKGRSAGLLQAMCDKDLKVYEARHAESGRIAYMTEDEIHAANEEWVQGNIVPETREDNLLTISGERAHELRLTNQPVADFDQFKQRVGIPQTQQVTPVAQTWVDTLVYVLRSKPVMFLLVVCGIGCIYLELYTMAGLFAIGSATCFSLFFWANFLGGTAGWLEVVFFLLGLLCIGLEVFVIPGFGVFGISGGLMIFLSLVLASQTFVIPETSGQVDEMAWSLGTITTAMVVFTIGASIVTRHLGTMPLLNRMVLQPPAAAGPQLDPMQDGHELSEVERNYELLDQQGTAATVLRPAGKATIGDRFVDVVSDGPFIKSGSTIEVVDVQGNKIVVREV